MKLSQAIAQVRPRSHNEVRAIMTMLKRYKAHRILKAFIDKYK